MTATLPRPYTPTRTVELVLAHAHLRLGALALARTELETLAGLGKLDTGGLIDLAEVRWRTGDLAGAGEAAAVVLRGEEEHPVALLIAAEATAALGRPSEARRLASRAMACATGSIDAIFAGMPRSAAWPPDGDEPPPTAPTLFDRAPEVDGRSNGTGQDASTALAISEGAKPAPEPTGPMTLGFWDDEVEAPGSRDLPDPARELEAGRAALVAGEVGEAAIKFGLALRLAPALAPAVLEATAGARGAGLLMVRGDAYRLAGHEMEAQEAYVGAANGGLPERRRRTRKPPKPDALLGDGSPPAVANKTDDDHPAADAAADLGLAEGDDAETDAGPTEAEAEPGSTDQVVADGLDGTPTDQGVADDLHGTQTHPPAATSDDPPA